MHVGNFGTNTQTHSAHAHAHVKQPVRFPLTNAEYPCSLPPPLFAPDNCITQSSLEPPQSSISITPPSLHSLPPPRHLPTNLKPVPLSPLLRPQILLIDLLPQLGELKRLTPTPLQPLPHAHRPPIRPRQPTNPRLHIPPQLQRHIAAVLQLARDIRDLVFGALLLEMQFADRVRGVWVLFRGGEGLL